MRKILAGLMATAMVTSLCATASFAVTNQAASVTATVVGTVKVDDLAPTFTWAGGAASNGTVFRKVLGFSQANTANYTQTITIDTVNVTMTDIKGNTIVTGSIPVAPIVKTNGGTISVTSSADESTAPTALTITPSAVAANHQNFTLNEIAASLSGQQFKNFEIDGRMYDGSFSVSGANVTMKFKDQVRLPDVQSVTMTFGGSSVVSCDNEFLYKTTSVATDPTTLQLYDALTGGEHKPTIAAVALPSFTATATGSAINFGQGDITADVSGNINIKDAVVCDGEGNPIPMTVDPTGVDKALNDSDGVQSKATVYFIIKDTKADGTKSYYNDDKYYKVRVKKGDNAKQVSTVGEKFKNFSANLYNVTNQAPVPGTSGRQRVIAVELNENYTTDEFKITLDMTLTPTQAAVDKTIAASSDELKVKDFSFYMKNIERTADNDWRVGINGLMLKPMANDWNDVTWYDEDGDVAHMRFFGDSDIKSFFSKLSTKWVHEDYAAYFNDQDAYYFEFTGSPKMSATSRADLEIYNPFTDIDGNETIDPSTATIYQIVDGDLVDVTDSFTYGEAENGENAFMTRTRFIGNYIICEKPVEEAVDGEIDDLMPDENEMPVTPGGGDTTGGGKNPANTGRYI